MSFEERIKQKIRPNLEFVPVKTDQQNKYDANKPDVDKHRPTTEEARLERSIRMSDLALNYYENRLNRGLDLNAEEQRLMISHQNQLAKLQMAKATLEAKKELGKKTNAELARDLLKKGWDREQILTLFGNDDKIAAALDGVDDSSA